MNLSLPSKTGGHGATFPGRAVGGARWGTAEPENDREVARAPCHRRVTGAPTGSGRQRVGSVPVASEPSERFREQALPELEVPRERHGPPSRRGSVCSSGAARSVGRAQTSLGDDRPVSSGPYERAVSRSANGAQRRVSLPMCGAVPSVDAAPWHDPFGWLTGDFGDQVEVGVVSPPLISTDAWRHEPRAGCPRR